MSLRQRLSIQRVALAAAAVLALGACGVELPDDVAARASTTTTTSTTIPSTTAVPNSDDELEQTLIDNGFSLEEAQCGAKALKDALSADEIDAINGLENLENIDSSIAEEYADAVSPCVKDGADPDEDGGN